MASFTGTPFHKGHIMIRFKCPDCGKSLKLDDKHGGKRIKCPKCDRKMRAPTPKPRDAPPAEEKVPALKDDLPPLVDDIPPLKDDPPVSVAAAAGASPLDEPEELDDLELMDEDELSDNALEPTGLDADALSMSLSDAAAQEGDGDAYELAELPQMPKAAAAAPVAAVQPRPIIAAKRPGPSKAVRMIGALIGGGIAALVGGFIWGATASASGYEVGWLAWGIGLATGLGAVLGGRGSDGNIGTIAVICAVAGIFIGKVVMVAGLISKEPDEVARQILNQLSFFDLLKATLSFYDIIWFVLAVGTAWRIGAGGDDDDD